MSTPVDDGVDEAPGRLWTAAAALWTRACATRLCPGAGRYRVAVCAMHRSAARRRAPVEVRRSARRRRTVSAYRDGERIVVLIPARFTAAEEREWVGRMVARVAGTGARAGATATPSWPARARELSERYLDGPARPASVRWVPAMRTRWASCTPADAHDPALPPAAGHAGLGAGLRAACTSSRTCSRPGTARVLAAASSATRAPSGPAATSTASARPRTCRSPTTWPTTSSRRRRHRRRRGLTARPARRILVGRLVRRLAVGLLRSSRPLRSSGAVKSASVSTGSRRSPAGRRGRRRSAAGPGATRSRRGR